MKRLFIYYSLTGNGDKIAKVLKEKNVEVRKVETTKKMPKKFFFRVLKGGFLAGLNHKEKLQEYDTDISSYDEIIIGSPVWNGKFSCPINTVLKDLDLANKKISFILYAGSGEASKIQKIIDKKYQGSSLIILKEPLKYHQELEKLS